MLAQDILPDDAGDVGAGHPSERREELVQVGDDHGVLPDSDRADPEVLDRDLPRVTAAPGRSTPPSPRDAPLEERPNRSAWEALTTVTFAPVSRTKAPVRPLTVASTR